jgi:DNA-binding transcriptional LysR family regulator
MLSLERHRRVGQIWDWLPAFRAVAEYQGVHKAAAAVAISPSALSRSVRLLEESLGGNVFARHSAGLSLTPLGERLLAVVRESMRRVDDCLAEAGTLLEGAHGNLSLGVTSGATEWFAARACLTLARERGTTLSTRQIPREECADELVRGGVDLALSDENVKHAEITSEVLTVMTHGVYSTTRKAQSLALSALTDPFVCVDGDDRWPMELPRTVRMVTPSVHDAVDAAQNLSALLVLPVLIGASFPALHKVADLQDTTQLICMRRKRLEGQTTEALDSLIATLQKTSGLRAQV